MENKQNNSIGALWAKTSKNGLNFLSGEVEINGEKHRIVAFPNKKQKDTYPDWRILLSDDNYQKPQEQPVQTQHEEPSASGVPF